MVTKPNWTILVYMVADTGDSFYRDAMEDVGEMLKLELNEQIRVVVHADAPSPWPAQCWEITGPPESEKHDGNVKIPVVLQSTGTARGLLNFIETFINKYDSDCYLLVLWGHGEGIDWKEKVLADREPSPPVIGAGKRFAPGSQGAIEIGELGRALAELKLNRTLDRKKVVVGFDACLMGMIEVYNEVKKFAGWGVAGADEIPDTGWPYTEVLKILASCPETLPEELAQGIVKGCAEWYSDNSPNADVSFAACDLSKTDAVLSSMGDLTEQLRTCIYDVSARAAVEAARSFAEDLQEKAYVDLHAFCSELMRQAICKPEIQQISGPSARVVEALGNFIGSRFKFSDGYPSKYSNDARAVSVCFPATAELAGSIPGLRVNWGSYEHLTFSSRTHWPCFLTEFWDRQRGAGDRRKPKLLVKAVGCE
jgi:hypothetical protein